MNNQTKIDAVMQLYQEAEKKISLFKHKTGLDCVPGCGACCNRFEPYISVLEGLVIAQYLQQNPLALKAFISSLKIKTDILFPFYQNKSSFHCGIYKIRPSICRLYAFSCKNTHGNAQYFPCPQIVSYYTKEMAIAENLFQEVNPLPVAQLEFNKLCEIDFVLATDLHPLTRSTELALENFSSIEIGSYQKKQEQRKSIKMAIPFSKLVRSHLQKKHLP